MKQINTTRPMSDNAISYIWDRAEKLSKNHKNVFVYFYEDGDYNVYDALLETSRNKNAEQLGYSLIGYYDDEDFIKA